MDDRPERRPTISRRVVLAASAGAAIGAVACGRSNDSSSAPTAAGEAVTIAKDAYVFGFPLVLMDFTRMAGEATAPVNELRNTATLPTPEVREVVRLNLDTLYSTAWLDLTSEPMVLEVPAMDGERYWLMQLLDAWTNTVHNPSSIRPGAQSPTPPYAYAVIGPGWSGALPDGLTPMPVPTPTAYLIGRIEVAGATDIPLVHGIQEQLKLVPLSAWTAGTEPPARAEPPGGRPEALPPPEQVANMAAREFFERMCAVMEINPPAPEDAPALRRFATIGIRPGGEVEGLSDAELDSAAATAQRQIPVYLGANSVNQNGWIYDPTLGRYGTDYLLRAAEAWNGLGAAPSENALYPTVFTSVDDINRGRFQLHFMPGQLPPVDAFWSLTAYDADSHLVPNPAKIYAVGHQIPVVLNPDSSLDITLQYADPGPSVPTGNWLPIPESGAFSLTLRLYAPQPEAVQAIWRPPALTPLP
ncbi:DUF1254 domain-containing protein [Nocardia gipuzkoensis]|uniref:DUF1254 domain-containing protein n=1 Tax=Nocardia gipuzkoensis TaxID=2749991 RepID=UPI0015EE8834|nr:DUF1254 domain-containing protein [Nocardia gipuzkoensis]